MQPVVFINDPEEIKLVADETRMKMLELLGGEEMTSNELAEALDVSQQLAYHHVKKLVDAGLAEIARTEQSGNITVYYYRAVAESFILGLSLRGKEFVDEQTLREEPPEEPDHQWFQTVQHVLDLLGFAIEDPDRFEELLRTDAQAFREAMERFSDEVEDYPDANPRVVLPAVRIAAMARMDDEEWDRWMDYHEAVRELVGPKEDARG